jgi:hypothetical protein
MVHYLVPSLEAYDGVAAIQRASSRHLATAAASVSPFSS